MEITVRPIYAVLAAFLLGVATVGAGVLLLGGLSGGDHSSLVIQAATPTPTTSQSAVQLSTPTQTPTSVPHPSSTPSSPTPQPAPAFRSCDEIRDSGTYLSEAERQFFLAECVSTPLAAAAVTPAPTATPRSALIPSTQPGDYAFIGAVWPDESIPVPYCVNPANSPIGSDGEPMVSTETFAALAQQAFATWQQIPTSYISFAYQGLCDSDPFDSHDGINTVGWGWLFGAAIGLADPASTHGNFQRQSTLGQLFEMDLVIDTRYAQSFDDPSEYISHDLPHILLHEAGHFIGLDHSRNSCSVMWPLVTDSGLCSVDIAAASALYPTPSPSPARRRGTMRSSVTPSTAPAPRRRPLAADIAPDPMLSSRQRWTTPTHRLGSCRPK